MQRGRVDEATKYARSRWTGLDSCSPWRQKTRGIRESPRCPDAPSIAALSIDVGSVGLRVRCGAWVGQYVDLRPPLQARRDPRTPRCNGFQWVCRWLHRPAAGAPGPEVGTRPPSPQLPAPVLPAVGGSLRQGVVMRRRGTDLDPGGRSWLDGEEPQPSIPRRRRSLRKRFAREGSNRSMESPRSRVGPGPGGEAPGRRGVSSGRFSTPRPPCVPAGRPPTARRSPGRSSLSRRTRRPQWCAGGHLACRPVLHRLAATAWAPRRPASCAAALLGLFRAA